MLRMTILGCLLALNSMILGQSKTLFIPPSVSDEKITLNIQNGEYDFGSGKKSQTMGINGDILAPTLILKKGEHYEFQVVNNLKDTTTIHWHGLHVAPEHDGGPHTQIVPGKTWNPKFFILDRASTFWYHPHLHHKANLHVQKGIAGMIIVRDEEEALLNLPRSYGIDDFPILLQTKGFDSNSEIIAETALDTLLLVNATANPYVEVHPQVNRFRLLNGASERTFLVGFKNNLVFSLIGTDGGLLDSAITMNRISVSPGERVEILLNLTESENTTVELMNFGSEIPSGNYGARQVGMGQGQTIPNYSNNPLNGNDFKILEIRVGNQRSTEAPTQIPLKLTDVPRINRSQIDTQRSIVFMPMNMGPQAIQGPFMFNDAMFDMDVINQKIKLNTTEVWTLRNQTPISHPFHIHHNHFEILDINGVAPPPQLRGKKDVVLVPGGNTSVRFIMRFENFSNNSVPYMYHCHMLTHEDHGMMGQFIIESPENASVAKGRNHFNFNVFPNPSSGLFTIASEVKSLAQAFSITDILGVEILQFQLEDFSKQLDFTNYSKGIYFIRHLNTGHVLPLIKE
jgi:FtsP/CotA-like multicopper oxidase with cupredoxin domain